MATSSILDSEATFIQQSEEAGLTRPWINALRDNVLATFAKLASQSPALEWWPLMSRRIGFEYVERRCCSDHSRASSVQKLVFESQTLMMHSFKSAAKGDEAAPKSRAPQERDARLERQRELLRGLDIKGPLEPAHALYDVCAAMIERNDMSYINPNRCLSRQQELMGSKPEKEIQLDATKTSLVVKEQQSHSEINISSDLALYQALQRRTLAMDLTGLASYEVMRRWVDRLFALYAQAPAPGFQKVTQAQPMRADRRAFLRISEQFTGSLKSFAGAGKPLDALSESLESDMTVTYSMLHIPAGHGQNVSSTDKRRQRQETP